MGFSFPGQDFIPNGGGGSAFDGFMYNVHSLGNKIGGAVDNLLTGDRDYQRSLDTLDKQNAFTAAESERARRYNSEEAEKNRAWQEHMSNTAYSRAAEDLKSLGINPYAMMSGFSAASSPSGSSASTSGARSGSGYYADSTKGLLSLVNNAFMLANTLLQGNIDVDIQDMRNNSALDVAHVYSRLGYKK